MELLISSDVAKYCEFKTISRVLTYINDKLEVVSHLRYIEIGRCEDILCLCVIVTVTPVDVCDWGGHQFCPAQSISFQ